MSDAFEIPEDVDERVTSLTVQEFVSTSKDLLSAGALDDFVKFVLTGVYRGAQHQINAIKDALQADHELHALRDYDSVLGIHPDVCVDAALTVYPISKFEDTLRRNIHIKYSFENQNGSHPDVPVHQIPNLCIAKWGIHNMIRVLLPGLYDSNHKTPFINQNDQSIFYEKGLRPAIEELLGNAAAEWPPTYSAEMFRARGKNGTLSFQTKTLPAWRAASLGDAIRAALSANNVLWGHGLVFLHQIRGVKASNGHTPDRHSATRALDELLEANNFRNDALQTGDWWIDVGLEIASQEYQCLAWRTDSHFHVVQSALRISTVKANRITRPGSSKYMRDMTSHLTAVSGCRISPGVQAQGPYHALYLQMYTTDKSITYRPDGTHFGKFLKGEDIFKGKANDYCHQLYELYREATDKNYALARIEVRVPYRYASSVLLDINVDRFCDGLVSFDPVVWWSLRAYRVRAFKEILEQQARGTAALRALDSALLLTAAAPWFLNGLHSVPDNGPSSRDLMGKILPLVDRDDAEVQTLAYPIGTRTQIQELFDEEEEEEEEEGNDNGGGDEDNFSVESNLSDDEDVVMRPNPSHRNNRPETVPYNPYGIVFLRGIRIGAGTVVPRFEDSVVPMIGSQSFHYIFGVYRDDVDAEFFTGQLVVPSNHLRVANKVHHTAQRVEDENEPQNIFNLAERGVQLPPLKHDEGSDLEDEVLEVVDEERDIDKKLTKLWRQFLVDVTAKVPNRRSASESSYCKLNKSQRDRVNEATYQNLRLREYFSDCQFATKTKEVWDKAFDKCWPNLGEVKVGSVQNFPTMSYYKSWVALLGTLQEEQEIVDGLRKVLRKRFLSFNWFPDISDRIWYTKPARSFKRFPESSEKEAAPRVMIRWDMKAIV